MVLRFLRRKFWNRAVSTKGSFKILRIEQCARSHSEASKAEGRVNETRQNASWRVLFFGTDDFALQSFKMVNEEYRQQRLIKRLEVVTAYKGKENALIRYANQHGIQIHSWPLAIPTSNFDVGLVVSFGYMIPIHMIESFPLGMINVHASLLPKLRGAAPIIHALMNGHTETGITIMKIMPNKFDIGEILAQERINIHPDETMPELYAKLAKLGANLLIETLEKLPNILSQGRPQNDAEATFARKITAESSRIKWNDMSAKNIYDLQRALMGLYCLTAQFKDTTIKLFGIRILEETPSCTNRIVNKPGFVMYDKQKNVLLVRCKDESWISIEKVVIPGRKPLSARDFKNGFIPKNKETLTFFG